MFAIFVAPSRSKSLTYAMADLLIMYSPFGSHLYIASSRLFHYFSFFSVFFNFHNSSICTLRLGWMEMTMTIYTRSHKWIANRHRQYLNIGDDTYVTTDKHNSSGGLILDRWNDDKVSRNYNIDRKENIDKILCKNIEIFCCWFFMQIAVVVQPYIVEIVENIQKHLRAEGRWRMLLPKETAKKWKWHMK